VAADGRVRVFECDNGEMLTEMHHKNNLKHKPTSVAFAPAPAVQGDVRGSEKKKKKKKKKKKNPFVVVAAAAHSNAMRRKNANEKAATKRVR
jgi:hypothetical protein